MGAVDQDHLRIASLIAHQLKSPTTSAMALLQTLLGEFTGPLNAKQREMVEKALARCEESVETTRRLMTIAQAMDKPDSLTGVTDLTAVITQIQHRYYEQARHQHISFDIEIGAESAFAAGKEPAVAEAIEALVHNAFKYTPDHGKIQIRVVQANDKPNNDTGIGRSEKGQSGDALLITVADSGIGIPEKEVPNLFQPFYRSSNARSSSRPGTGLGLAFVKAIIDAVGGKIRVGRADIGGAEFELRLPRAATPVSAVSPAKGRPAFKVVIVGGVAAGPKVAARVMRLRPDAQVTIIERGRLLSYAGCGLPFYVSGIVKNQYELMSSPAGLVRDPVFFQKVKNVEILNQTQADSIDRKGKTVTVTDLTNHRQYRMGYDKLVLATGAVPVIPPVAGVHLGNIFTLHGPTDAEGIKAALETSQAHDVIIVGGGLIGVEITEALSRKGCRVTIIEKDTQILGVLDWEMAHIIEKQLQSQGVKVLTDTAVTAFEGNDKVESVMTNRGAIPTDLVVLATGFKPLTDLAELAGLDIGDTGGIKVNGQMQTSDPDIYAAGDCVENMHAVTGKAVYIPLGSTANKQGRVVAGNICGGEECYPPILGTVSCKVFDYGAARTGLNEREAVQAGFETLSVLVPAPDKEHFVPQAKLLMIKLVVDKTNRRILGLQTVGPGNGDKRVDVAVMAIANKFTVDQLANMDLCYSPNFSPVMDNLITAANVARNKLDGHLVGIGPMALRQAMDDGEDMVLLDVRTPVEYEQNRIAGSMNIPLGALRERVNELPHEQPIVTFCNYSLRGYEAAIILRSAGFKAVKVLDGGIEMWPYELH